MPLTMLSTGEHGHRFIDIIPVFGDIVEALDPLIIYTHNSDWQCEGVTKGDHVCDVWG